MLFRSVCNCVMLLIRASIIQSKIGLTAVAVGHRRDGGFITLLLLGWNVVASRLVEIQRQCKVISLKGGQSIGEVINGCLWLSLGIKNYFSGYCGHRLLSATTHVTGNAARKCSNVMDTVHMQL